MRLSITHHFAIQATTIVCGAAVRLRDAGDVMDAMHRGTP